MEPITRVSGRLRRPTFFPAAEEIAISWPRITAFAESHRRRGLVSGKSWGSGGTPQILGEFLGFLGTSKVR